MGMNHRAGSSTPSEHSRHDQVLMARLAGNDLDPSERSMAEALRSACPECRQLHEDLQTLMRASTDLPAPRRQRDFRLSEEQAARLRGSWLDRVMERLAAPSLGVLQPLAGAAMALGFTLLVVNALPFSQSSAGSAASPLAAPMPGAEMGGATAAAATPEGATRSDGYTDTAASPHLGAITTPTPYRAVAGASRVSPTPASLAGGDFETPADERTEAMEQERDRLALQTSGPDWLLIGVLLIIGGLAIFVARVLAVRQMRDPRLQ